jgi:hypothetical protein
MNDRVIAAWDLARRLEHVGVPLEIPVNDLLSGFVERRLTLYARRLLEAFDTARITATSRLREARRGNPSLSAAEIETTRLPIPKRRGPRIKGRR